MSRKSGNRFSDKDMLRPARLRRSAHFDANNRMPTQSLCDCVLSMLDVAGRRYFAPERRTILMGAGGTPDFSAIARSCSSIIARAGSSPSRPPSTVLGTLRLERWSRPHRKRRTARIRRAFQVFEPFLCSCSCDPRASNVGKQEPGASTPGSRSKSSFQCRGYRRDHAGLQHWAVPGPVLGRVLGGTWASLGRYRRSERPSTDGQASIGGPARVGGEA